MPHLSTATLAKNYGYKLEGWGFRSCKKRQRIKTPVNKKWENGGSIGEAKARRGYDDTAFYYFVVSVLTCVAVPWTILFLDSFLRHGHESDSDLPVRWWSDTPLYTLVDHLQICDSDKNHLKNTTLESDLLNLFLTLIFYMTRLAVTCIVHGCIAMTYSMVFSVRVTWIFQVNFPEEVAKAPNWSSVFFQRGASQQKHRIYGWLPKNSEGMWICKGWLGKIYYIYNVFVKLNLPFPQVGCSFFLNYASFSKNAQGWQLANCNMKMAAPP